MCASDHVVQPVVSDDSDKGARINLHSTLAVKRSADRAASLLRESSATNATRAPSDVAAISVAGKRDTLRVAAVYADEIDGGLVAQRHGLETGVKCACATLRRNVPIVDPCRRMWET